MTIFYIGLFMKGRVMRVKFNFKRKHLAQLMLSGALIGAAHVSFGQEAVDLGTVQSNAGTDTSCYVRPYLRFTDFNHSGILQGI